MEDERKQSYELIYKTYNDGNKIELDEVRLVNGAKLYEIESILSKGFPSNFYYIVAFNKQEARSIYNRVLSYMKIIKIEELPDEEAKVILKNLKENCVIF